MVTEVKAMDVKKIQKTSSDLSFSGKEAENFITEIKTEVEKISWTSKEELFFYAKVVILSTFLFGLSIFCFDLIVQNVLSGLNALLRLIGS